MNITLLREMGLALLFVLLQAIVFNQINLFGIAVPMVFIYIIFRMPLSMPTAWLLTASFFLGLAVDIFSNTPGMNALACTILAFMRRFVLSLYLPHGSDYVAETPSIRGFGLWLYVRYSLTLTFIYCVLLLAIESLSLLDFPYMLMRIVGSTLLTFLFILCIDSLSQGREKRL
ncbi:MAG: rod shape-determining protein MreD [Bacteroidaceae bacterium]|mgnify:CR=1 FL=1|nr:rod shape-determining protein MreD [Bacteroidaceae bacterium]